MKNTVRTAPKQKLSQRRKTKRAPVTQPHNPDWSKRLACIFYGLAIVYYLLQLVDKAGLTLQLPNHLILENSRVGILGYVLQAITIAVMFLKRR